MGAKHDYELVPDAYTHLHLDHRHMGVGGDDSWSPSLHKVQVQHCIEVTQLCRVPHNFYLYSSLCQDVRSALMFAGICCGPRRVQVFNAPVPYPANPEDGAIRCSVPPVAAAHPVLGS